SRRVVSTGAPLEPQFFRSALGAGKSANRKQATGRGRGTAATLCESQSQRRFRILQVGHGGEEPPSACGRAEGFKCFSDAFERCFGGSIPVPTPFRLSRQPLQPFAAGACSAGFDRADGSDSETSGPAAKPL